MALAQIVTKDYLRAMNSRRASILRTLLLLTVALGPLQAHVAFACAMMDTVVHEECCCGDHEPVDRCTDHDCESKLDSAGSCCEASVELGLDEEAGEAATVKPPESDPDPPAVLLVSSDILFDPDPSPVPDAFSRRAPGGACGSDTWLVTRRLRI
jgi:hypothetical protein